MAANEFWFCRMPISWDIDMANLAGKDINVCEKPKRKLEGQLAITTHNIVRHNVGDIFGSRSCGFSQILYFNCQDFMFQSCLNELVSVLWIWNFKIINFDSSETVGRIFERIINIHCTCIYPVKRLNCFDDIPIKIKCITFKFLSGGTYVFFNHGHAKSFVLASTRFFRLERHFYF